MLKETIFILIAYIIVFFILRFFLKRNTKIFNVISIAFLSIFTLANIYFTFKTYIPNFALDETASISDLSENLFLYKSDSEYSSELLFTVLYGRDVYLDTSQSKDFYLKLLKTYSKNVSCVLLSQETNQHLINDISYDHVSRFFLVELLDYIFEENNQYNRDHFLTLHICTDGLSDSDAVIVTTDHEFNFYLVSEQKYNQIATQKGWEDIEHEIVY